MDLWIRAAKHADVGRVNGPPQGFYRVHGANMHTTVFGTALVEARARLQVFDDLGTTWDVDEPEKRDLLRRARRAISVEAIRSASRLLDSPGRERADAANDLVAFAKEICPAVSRTLTWRAYQARGRGPFSSLQNRIDAFLYRLRWSLRWRRWRRVGI